MAQSLCRNLMFFYSSGDLNVSCQRGVICGVVVDRVVTVAAQVVYSGTTIHSGLIKQQLLQLSKALPLNKYLYQINQIMNIVVIQFDLLYQLRSLHVEKLPKIVHKLMKISINFMNAITK